VAAVAVADVEVADVAARPDGAATLADPAAGSDPAPPPQPDMASAAAAMAAATVTVRALGTLTLQESGLGRPASPGTRPQVLRVGDGSTRHDHVTAARVVTGCVLHSALQAFTCDRTSKEPTVHNEVQLITYADRLAGSIRGLEQMLTTGPLAGLFGGVHLLPFFRPYDGADAGFDPADHREVDARLGSWDDVEQLSRSTQTVVDLIVNHVSSDSPWFQDVLARGDDSPYIGMFLTYEGLFPDGATEAELLRIYRPRPGLPFTTLRLGERKRMVWTTFTKQQIDLDLRDPQARGYLTEVIELLARHGVTMVRVDAVGYAVKTPGTSSFMTPETFAFIEELSAQMRGLGLEVLVEVHSYYERQIEIARQVDRVYDFGLPPLVLHALHSGDARPLLRWLDIRPLNAVTVLDTHDGIGVIDVGADATRPDKPGLLTPSEIDALVEAIHAATGGTSRLATGGAARNVDLYQVNSTFYDALGRDDGRYLLARMVQFLAPGVPQVYYVGLLAGANDMELLAESTVGRDVNRHHYTPDEVAAAMRRPVVVALCALIRLRNAHPAFGGSFGCAGGDGAGALSMRWDHGDDHVALTADTGQSTFTLEWTTPDGVRSASSVWGLAEAVPAAG
jgi:sucrose phosphorylase